MWVRMCANLITSRQASNSQKGIAATRREHCAAGSQMSFS